jgi:hypothetical protein
MYNPMSASMMKYFWGKSRKSAEGLTVKTYANRTQEI